MTYEMGPSTKAAVATCGVVTENGGKNMNVDYVGGRMCSRAPQAKTKCLSLSPFQWIPIAQWGYLHYNMLPNIL